VTGGTRAGHLRELGGPVTVMLLREVLPRFHAEATAVIVAKPDDEIPEGMSRDALPAQFDTLILTGPRAARPSVSAGLDLLALIRA
jgi:hypothetical protein